MPFVTRRGDEVKAGDRIVGPEDLMRTTGDDTFLVLASGPSPYEGQWRITLEAGGGHGPWILEGLPSTTLLVLAVD